MNRDRPNATPDAVSFTAVPPDAVRKEAERICADPLFRHSHRSSNLLKFIVDRTLEGHKEDLKERIIGIEVFGRSPDYDTSNDSTVRVVANEVRKRLAEYYAKPEHEQEVRIDIPIRSYVAEFRLCGSNRNESEAKVEPKPEKRRQLPRRWYVWGPAAAMILGLSVWAFVLLLSPVPVIDSFWAPVTDSAGPALICVGSPAESPAARPSSPDSVPPGTPFYDSEQRVNVRMMDANGADELAAYLQRKGKHSLVRPTQATDLPDLRSSTPAILYGMFLNQSAMNLGADVHFRLRKDSESGHGLRWIEDASNPANRDWFVDLSKPYEEVGTDYALITRVRDETTERWWVGIAGLTGVGTLAASHLVTDPKAMSVIGAHLPKNWNHKNLQIVLEVKVVQGKPGATRVLKTSIW